MGVIVLSGTRSVCEEKSKKSYIRVAVICIKFVLRGSYPKGVVLRGSYPKGVVLRGSYPKDSCPNG